MALINSRALKQEARPPMGDRVAKKDIIRRNYLGQSVVVVPKGQPIPDGFDITDEERGSVKKQVAPLENKAGSGRPTPKSEK